MAIALCFILFACEKELKVDYPDEPSVPVLNVFFTPDSLWKARLVYSKMKTDTSYRPIKDAQLSIVGDDGSTTILHYTAEGYYQADIFPRAGVRYTIHALLADGTDLSGTSFAPEEPNLSVVSFNSAWSTYLFDADLMDYSVMPVYVNISDELATANLQFRFWNAFPKWGRDVNRYFLSSDSLVVLEQKGIPASVINALLPLTDQWQMSFYAFEAKLNNIPEWLNYSSKYENILRATMQTQPETDPRAFDWHKLSIFSLDGWLQNVGNNTSAVFGTCRQAGQANLLLSDDNLKWRMERNAPDERDQYWLEVRNCSPAYFRYTQDYMLQVSQRMNPYAEPVTVYSNITNGVGIFAGYNRQLIKLMDY